MVGICFEYGGIMKFNCSTPAELLKEIKDARSTIEKGYIAHGAWMVYKALKVQSEADEMNKLWGQ